MTQTNSYTVFNTGYGTGYDTGHRFVSDYSNLALPYPVLDLLLGNTKLNNFNNLWLFYPVISHFLQITRSSTDKGENIYYI